jgi:hypothetical protein
VNEILQRLLNTRSLDWNDPSVSFGFERPLPAWAWAGVVIAAVGVALWSYSRLAGTAWARWALGGVRALLLMLLVVLLCGPQLVKREDLSENDWVLVLVDRSASLSVEDAPGAATGTEPAAARRTREQQLEAALAASQPMWESLTKDRTVVWLGFDSGAYDLRPGTAANGKPGVPTLEAPKGQRTALGTALDQALARAAARPLAGVVIVSDGRSIDEPSRQAVRRLESEKVPVVSVALGSEKPVGDLAVRRVDAPKLAFVSDLTPVRVEIERTGGVEAGASPTAKVRLIDRDTGRVLDEKTVDFGSSLAGASTVSARTSLATRGQAAGVSNWAVEIVPDGGGSPGSDLIVGNNRVEMSVEMIDRPLRVLYVDGYPRWEQRYIKNLLVREKSISCSTLILSPDKKFIQEGDVELDALPDSPERWAEFDAIILGDVSPDVFTREQLLQLKEHVARRGGGLIWVAGPSFTPLAWTGTSLADLLPFQKDAVDGTTLAAPALMKPTPEADRLGLLRLNTPGEDVTWPPALASFDTGWSQLQWVQRIEPTRLKPTTEVLATADLGTAARRTNDRPFPIVMTMKYGAGRVIYNATDEVWRWRYARGETLYERFWTPMIRLLGRDALSRSGQSAVLEVSSARAVVDQPVRVSVQLLDQSLVDLGLGSVVVRVVPKRKAAGTDADAGAAPVELTLRAETAGAPGTGEGGGSPGSRTYATVWIPTEAGEYTVELSDTALAGRIAKGSLGTEVQVFLPDDELRSPDANHPLLAALSERTGGVVLKPDEMASIPAHLPNRKVRVVNETAQPLWDTPMALLLSVLLLTLEWVCRRVIRLV